DDDQIIYQWNGASFRQIQRFSADFAAHSIQLTENHRCPPSIVEAANKLVAYNTHRTASKRPLVAAKPVMHLPAEHTLQERVVPDDTSEAAGVAKEIAGSDTTKWPRTAVLARTRALLDRVHSELQARNVPAVIVQRRDDFLSAEFRWMVAFLR